VATTSVSRLVRAPRSAVYAALVEREAVARWKFPAGMSCVVHEYDARPGGRLRISLTYETTDGVGKTTSTTDTYSGRFAELVPDERVVEIDEFETDDPALQGEMRATFELRDADGGTEVTGVHEDVPPGVSPEDNEAGWRSALDRLAALVERP
jgi:uncharacterized protein YndB with AHSA1/START domain